MKEQIFYIIGFATCLIVSVSLLLFISYILLKLWCKFIIDTFKVYENSRVIKDWFREKDSYYQWKSDLDSFRALENYSIESIDFDMESGDIKRIYGDAKNTEEARKSLMDNEVFKVKSIPFIISYLDNSGHVEFTPVSAFLIDKS